MQSRIAIRDAGLRVTRQRVAVLDAVGCRPHASAATVLAEVATVLPGVSHQAVYDCLAHLTDAGLLRRFVAAGGPMLDERRTPEAHHHFVCRTCNLVVDVDCDVGAPRLTAPHAESFVIDEAEVTYRGICADCVALRPSLEPPLVSG